MSRDVITTAEEKKTRKINRLARSLLIQGLSNDIYSLIDSNETAKDLWDALIKKAIVVTSDPLALVVEKTKVSKCKEKVEVQTESKGSDDEDISDLKKITAFDEQVLLAEDQAWLESSNNSEKEINANMVFMAQIKKVLSDSNESSSSAKETITEASRENLRKTTKISELEGCVSNKDVEIEKCLERLNECENKLHKIRQTNQTIHMIMPSKDTLYNGRKGIGFENPSYSEKVKDLRPSLYDEKVIGLGYTLMFLIHSDEALEIEKFKRARENKIEFAYDYGNLNASYVNEKINFLDDYFQEIINPNFEKIDSRFQQTSSLKSYVLTVILEKIIIDLEDEVVSLLEKEKANLETIESLKSKGFESSENEISESENQSEEYDQIENSKVIAPGMFKLSVSQSVSLISLLKTSCNSKNVENKTKRKRRKRKSSKQNDKQVNNDVSHANSDFVHFSDLVTFSSVRRPKQSSVIWKKKGSSNTLNVDLSSVSHSKLNKDVKRYSRKDLLSCNNSYLGETSSAYVCNDAMNVSCNSRLCDSFGENNVFIFNDESVRISPVSKMHFRKKPRDSMNVRSKRNSNQSLPRIVHRWLPKMQPFAKPVAKWIPRIVQICIWIIDSGCSNHMTGNRALLKNFVKKFLGTNATTKWCLGKEESNLSRSCKNYAYICKPTIVFWAEAIATACFTQNHSIIHKRFNKTPYELMNKRKPNIKFFRMFGCRCYLLNDYEDVGKLKAKKDIIVFVGYSIKYAAFKNYNKQTRKIHESVNVNFDEISEMASKQFSLEPGLSNLNKTGKSSNPLVSQVSKTSKKDLEDLFQNFYDEYFDSSKIMKSLTTNVETSNVEVPSNEKEVFHESSKSFQEESSSSSLNDDV
nr:retrovirus-related Pol polyprotein from transposon TNT 1-94 [Tanacetum cinerariifolium]